MSALTTAEPSADFKAASRQLAEMIKRDTLDRAPEVFKAYIDRLEDEMPDMDFGDATKGVRTVMDLAGLTRLDANEKATLPTFNITIFGEGGHTITAEAAPPKNDGVIDVAAREMPAQEVPEVAPLPPLAVGDLPDYDMLFSAPPPSQT